MIIIRIHIMEGSLVMESPPSFLPSLENVIDELSSYCDSERLNAKETRKIGF